MADKKTEPKVLSEKDYIVPLRKEWSKVPEYKRVNKAIKALKEFLVRHMKVYDRDLNKIKIDVNLNNELRFRGIKKPPAKINIRAKKFDDGIVKAELIKMPAHLTFKKLREEKKKRELEKKVKEKEESKKQIQKAQEKSEDSDKKEKLEASKEESLKISEKQAKEQKHISKEKKVVEHRKELGR